MSILLERTNPANQMMGEILVTQQWITPAQLDSALSEQRRTNQKLGEILVRLGHLTQMDLNFILSQQKGNTLTGESDNVKLRLGDILRKSKRVSQRDLATAVDEQKKTNEKLGSVLLRMGMLDQTELSAVLAWQDDFNQADPLAVRLLLGEILVSSKTISRKHLVSALEEQKLTKKQIGQILLDSGHVNKFDLRNALKIQTKMVAASLLLMMGAMTMTGCGVSVANPTGAALGDITGQKVSYEKVYPNRLKNAANAQRLQGFNTSAQYKVANLPGGRQLQRYVDGSILIKDVPFVSQGHDNTCAQATTTAVLNYWGVKQDYQELVNQQNRINLATHYTKIVDYMNSQGLQAKAFRGGNVSYLKNLVDQGKPAIAMLEFNNDLFQQHYITVVGYNADKGTIIFHDSVDGPYRQLSEDEFESMWQSKHLSNLPVFGGANFQGLIIEISK